MRWFYRIIPIGSFIQTTKNSGYREHDVCFTLSTNLQSLFYHCSGSPRTCMCSNLIFKWQQVVRLVTQVGVPISNWLDCQQDIALDIWNWTVLCIIYGTRMRKLKVAKVNDIDTNCKLLLYPAVGTLPPPTTTPAPPGGEAPPPPLYRVVLYGNFTSSNGEDFTLECIGSLRENFQVKAASLVPGLNSMIGTNLCNYLSSGDVTIISVSTILGADGTAVSMFAYVCVCVHCATFVFMFNNHAAMFHW